MSNLKQYQIKAITSKILETIKKENAVITDSDTYKDLLEKEHAFLIASNKDNFDSIAELKEKEEEVKRFKATIIRDVFKKPYSMTSENDYIYHLKQQAKNRIEEILGVVNVSEKDVENEVILSESDTFSEIIKNVIDSFKQ